MMPTLRDIREARVKARLTQQKAAKLILVHLRTWQRWESGQSRMPDSTFEYFKIVTNQ